MRVLGITTSWILGILTSLSAGCGSGVHLTENATPGDGSIELDGTSAAVDAPAEAAAADAEADAAVADAADAGPSGWLVRLGDAKITDVFFGAQDVVVAGTCVDCAFLDAGPPGSLASGFWLRFDTDGTVISKARFTTSGGTIFAGAAEVRVVETSDGEILAALRGEGFFTFADVVCPGARLDARSVALVATRSGACPLIAEVRLGDTASTPRLSAGAVALVGPAKGIARSGVLVNGSDVAYTVNGTKKILPGPAALWIGNDLKLWSQQQFTAQVGDALTYRGDTSNGLLTRIPAAPSASVAQVALSMYAHESAPTTWSYSPPSGTSVGEALDFAASGTTSTTVGTFTGPLSRSGVVASTTTMNALFVATSADGAVPQLTIIEGSDSASRLSSPAVAYTSAGDVLFAVSLIGSARFAGGAVSAAGGEQTFLLGAAGATITNLRTLGARAHVRRLGVVNGRLVHVGVVEAGGVVEGNAVGALGGAAQTAYVASGLQR